MRRASSETWFLQRSGKPKVNHLSREHSKVLVAAGMSKEEAKEPQRRTRRYWESRMRSVGRTDMIEAMGGHSREVGFDHYADLFKVVEALKGEDF